MSTEKKKITIREIAEEANVSISTVSRVINNYKWVNPEVRQSVLDVIQRLHYSPNYNASAMAKGRSGTVVLLVPTILNPFFTAFTSTAMHILREAGYVPLIYEAENHIQKEREFLLGSIGQLADAVISATDNMPDELLEEIVAFYNKRGTPMIFVDRNLDVSLADSIMQDNIGAVSGLVDYFVKAGHRRIAMIMGKWGVSVCREKVEGYNRGLKKNGLPFCPEYIRQGEWKRETGEREVLDLLRLDEPPTAIFAANNYICRGVLDGLHERNLQAGRDISIIGTEECAQDTIDFQKMGISTLRLESEALAVKACQRILERLEDGSAAAAGNYTKTIFSMNLIERDSVAVIPDPLRQAT